MRTGRNVLVTAVSAVVLAVTSLLGAGQATADARSDDICLVNLDTRRECFWVGFGALSTVPGYVYHRWQYADGGWSGFQPLNAYSTSDIAGASNANGRLEVFIRGTNGNLLHNWQVTPGGNWNGWQSLGGNIAAGTDPRVYVSNNRIHVNVTWIDGSTRLRHQTQPNCCWSNWIAI